MSLERYARTVCGDTPEGVADWQLVARELYNRLSERPDRLLDNAREAVNDAFDRVETAVDPFTKPEDLTHEQLQPVFKLLLTLRRVGRKIAEGFIADEDPEERTVQFHRVSEPGDDPDYRFQVRVTMSWVQDGDGMSRQENAHGDTAESAFAMARAIAAAFMFEESVDSESWPPNGIDQLPMN